MSIKDFFFINPKSEKEKASVENTNSIFPKSESNVKFPTSENKVDSTKLEPVSIASSECAPHMDKILKLYEDGFNGLNQEGYDFYEYFQAIIKTDLKNPAMYEMALTMAKAMDSKVSKENLLNQSTFYIDEINKVYQNYVDNGKQKKEQVLSSKKHEQETLTQELEKINRDLIELSQLKNQKEVELSKIDLKYAEELTEVECKLMANDFAKDKIIGTIKTVVEGINKNL